MNIETLRNEYRDAILQLAEKHLLENVRIFGSTARGEAGADSDIDLLVHPKPRCSLYDIVGFEYDVSGLLGGVKVDVLDDEAIKDILKPYILGEAEAL